MAEHLSRPAESFCRCRWGEALFSQWLSILVFFSAEELLDEEIEQLIEERNQAKAIVILSEARNS